MIVVDASILLVGLVDDDADGDAARRRLREQVLLAPDLVYLEVSSVLRRHVAAERLDRRRAELALEDLLALPLRTVEHLPLVKRIWQLRDTVTVYDAAYVAVAEHFNAPLITGDARLARAPGPTCTIELFPPEI
ncbi:VapC toxin family PIN domain ribonuclease [Aeromicrobium sp. PE09-221]|uniref:type II toxin-antitoxin system VapC family toxin n=1 Tax=Aeromicrobium sp. PE09-221 TaxID=1898043 RepID=UPI000B3E9951|nr:type II toxin-antitoxin system VapC family toxin [Aeromicrobium sp. PE09-221]OUZ07283.1 VapC toxin family PIN domain ribonuclease [Aeromicrobium sp. PE09-221]